MTRGRRFLWPWALCAAALLLPGSASAHLLNMTEVDASVDVSGEIRVALDIDLLREMGSPAAYHAFSLEPTASRHDALWTRLAAAIEVRQQDALVPLQFVSATPPPDVTLADYESDFVWPKTRVLLRGQLAPGVAVSMRFTGDFIFEEPIALTLRAEATGASRSRWLVTHQRSPRLALGDFVVPEPGLSLADFLSFVVQGARHILPSGLDHLLFLLGLCLTCRGLRPLIGLVSVFTLAHSVTLVIASFSLVAFDPRWVECLIVASIGWMGFEALGGRSFNWSRVAVIAGFGLLHGLGFALAFADFDGGDHFIARLLAFNIGIEVGQVLFVAAVAAALVPLQRRDDYATRVRRPASMLLIVVASGWLLTLLMGA